MARQLQETLAGEVNGAGAGLIEAAQTIQERRLAGAVRADQAADLPALTSNDTLSRATIPPKRTDNPLMLSSGALLSATSGVLGRSALKDASVWRRAAITWSAVIAHALRCGEISNDKFISCNQNAPAQGPMHITIGHEYACSLAIGGRRSVTGAGN